MKYSIFLIFFCFLNLHVSGQVFNIETDSTSVEIDVDLEIDASFQNDLNFTGDSIKSYIWTAQWDAPDEWDSQLCLNPIKCYGYNQPTASETFVPGEDYEFALKVFHNGVCGEGTYTLQIREPGIGVIDEVVYTVTATNCAIVNTTAIENFDFSIQPNPVMDAFQITANQAFEKLEIYSISGQKILDFNPSDRYDISQLSGGTYIVKMIDNNGQSKLHKLIKM